MNNTYTGEIIINYDRGLIGVSVPSNISKAQLLYSLRSLESDLLKELPFIEERGDRGQVIIKLYEGDDDSITLDTRILGLTAEQAFMCLSVAAHQLLDQVKGSFNIHQSQSGSEAN